MPRKTMVGWALAGGIAIAALAIGYGLGRAGDDRSAGGLEELDSVHETEGADVGGPLGGDEAAPLRVRETVSETEAPAAVAPSRTPSARAGERVLQPGQRVEVEVPESEIDRAPEPLQPELVRDEPELSEATGVSQVVTIPAGTPLRIRLTDGVSSQTSQVGDAVTGELIAPIVVDGRTLAASGTRVRGEVVEVQPLQRIGGRAKLAFVFDRLILGELGVPIEAAWSRLGKSETGKDAATIAGGAVAGAVLGNQAKKNDRGRILGGLLGAGVGAAVASKTQGEKIELPAGTELEVTLADPVVATVDGR